MIAAEGRGVLVLLGDAHDAEATLARIREQPVAPASRAGTLAQWRRTGAGSQILSDLGLHRLRVLGTPRRQVGLAGFGLEVVEYAALPPR
jgi:3,4-dihydroxy 2-butanone 4-phosphate synthase/GTP cyclohydrolase II